LVTAAIRQLARCYASRFAAPDSVFVAEVSFDVRWGDVSVLEAELQCAKELLERRKDWK
jgi:hypothetical protein